MRNIFIAIIFGCIINSNAACDDFIQPSEMRSLCTQAQNTEYALSEIEERIAYVLKEARGSAPVIRHIYEILSRCFTTLFDIQRFSPLLALNQRDNKNDFVRASIIIKNFASYFSNVSEELKKFNANMQSIRQTGEMLSSERDQKKSEHSGICNAITELAKKLSSSRSSNSIQNDVVCHIANKSETIEELDAELEAENTVGVLKNKKISTELVLHYPVVGKIIAEFGDKGINDQMIYYIAFETMPGAVVTSPAKGLVVFSGKFLNYGNMVIISNGEYRIFIYGLDTVFALTGDVLEIGDYIGNMSQRSIDKPVLKMELKKSGEPLDPRHWLVITLEKENKL